MQIDRARFLLLTASLAGGGCSANPASDPAPQPIAGSSGLAVAADGTADPAETTTTSSDDTADPVETAQAIERADPPTPTPSATALAGACDNDTAAVPACSIVAPPGPFCESFSDTKASCKAYKSALRGAIAAQAVACLNATSGTQDACDYTKSETCATTAIRSACVQPSTFSLCAPLVSTCAGSQWSKLTMPDCQALLSAVKDGKRSAMITCMSEGCSIDSCTWALR